MTWKYTPPTPADIGLPPPYDNWNTGQREAVEQIMELWHSGVRHVMLNGPTGSGKSCVGISAAKLYQQRRDIPGNVTVLTQTKDLQQQYANDFPEASVATGRGNWLCGAQTGKRANKCEYIGTERSCDASCMYRIQRDAAVKAPIRIINYALYGATGHLFHAPMMVTDEADYLGELLTNSKSADLSLLVEHYNLQVPQGTVDGEYSAVLEGIKQSSAVPEEREACKHGIELLESGRYVVKGVGNVLRPFPESRVVGDFVRQPTLQMSATVFAPQHWAKVWGIPVGWVELPCQTPPSQRPIHLLNVKRINKDTTEEDWKFIIEALDKVVGDRVESKGLIHSTSNWLTDMILKYSKYRHLMFKASGEQRLKSINAFVEADRGILLGPSLLRGLNLNDDLCRWIIFPKIPYPSLGDPRVQEMMKGGDEQYYVETVGSLIQGCGRGVRHSDDHCETFILDSGAGYLFKRTGDWLPQWFKEAIVYN